MRNHRTAATALCAIIIAATAVFAAGKKQPAPAKQKVASEYVGSKLCLACHVKYTKKWPTFPHSKKLMDPSRKGDQHGCEACHGPGRKHTSTDRKDMVRFHKLTPAQKDAICLKCHAPKVTSANWKKSGHAKQEMSCTLCHDMHDPAKPAKMLRNRFDDCSMCHGEIKDKAAAGEHHKLPAGTSCTACHTPHGSPNPSGLIKSKTELCKGCHGESASALPESHQAKDWKKTHGKTEDRSSCGACHGKEDTCSKCHGGVEMPHPTGWMMGHKDKGASFDANSSCLKCHDRKEFCGRCHS